MSPFLAPRVRTRFATLPSRDTLVLGVDKPSDPDKSGVIAGVARPTTITTDTTFTTNGLTVSNTNFQCKIKPNASNITFKNCYFSGGNSTPDTFGIVDCRSTGFTNRTFIDCTFSPDIPHWDWNGITAYGDIKVIRCDIKNVQDCMQIRNPPGRPATNIVIEQSWLHSLSWWTAATTGIVHPSDTETHNDLIQQLGGSGTVIRGNMMDARYARQQGHWWCTGSPTTEPYTSIALNSLGAGAPYYGGPYEALPDRGSGTEATGRYNAGIGSISGLMINDNAGQSNAFVFEDNWCYGGNYFCNGGGNTNLGDSANLGSFKRNKFSRDQGSQSTGGNATHTLNFVPGSGLHWSAANSDIPLTGPDANIYENDGAYITVRY